MVGRGGVAVVRTTVDPRSDAYRDAMELTLAGPTGSTAIEWARAIIERSPVYLRLSLPPGWWVLGMRLARDGAGDGAAERVHGWPVVVERPDQVVLAGRSTLGFDARLVVEVEGPLVRFRSEMRHRTPGSRRLWRAIGLAHRTIIARMMRHAASELAA